MEKRKLEGIRGRDKKKSGSSGFLVQGSIYAASGIISSLIGLLYRIPLTRIIGDEGNGYYSTAFNVYTIILLLSSYSLPLAVSKMISARVGEKKYRNADRILKASLAYATLVGGLGCAAIFFGAGWFADSFLHIPEAGYPLRALAPTVWIVSYLGVCRGYWQGHSTMVPTALSQVIEQIVNAFVSVGAAYLLLRFSLRQGHTESTARAFGAMGGTIGTGAGAFAALLLFILLFAVNRRYLRERRAADRSEQIESYREITEILILTVIPVILSTAIYNMSGILDNALFGRAMFLLGQQGETARNYGIYSGKYKLLVNVPIMVANSLGTALIPALSRANAARDRGQVDAGVSNAIRFAMIVAIPSAVGLAVMADPLIPLLFGKSERAVLMMRIGCPGVVFYSLSTVTNAILQGTSHMKIPVRHALISMALHVGILEFLLFVPKLGIFAVVAADMGFALCMCLLNAASLKKLLNYRQEIRRTFVGPLFCALMMGAATLAVKLLLQRFTGIPVLYTVLPIAVAIAVYALLLIVSGSVTEYELRLLPRGTMMVRVARKLHLL